MYIVRPAVLGIAANSEAFNVRVKSKSNKYIFFFFFKSQRVNET